MFWLALGSMFLMLVSRGNPARMDSLSVIALLCFIATAAGTSGVYPLHQAALCLTCGLMAGLILARTKIAPKSLGLRLLVLILGGAASAFALFGPAEGLFPRI